MKVRSAKSHAFGHVDPNKLQRQNTSKVDPRGVAWPSAVTASGAWR